MSRGSTAGSPRSTRLLHCPAPTSTGVRASGVMSLPSGGQPTIPVIDILLVCTANQCRSPMAEGLLRRLFVRAGVGAQVGSAGLLPGGAPATANAVATMAARGIDISGHVEPHPRPRVRRHHPAGAGHGPPARARGVRALRRPRRAHLHAQGAGAPGRAGGRPRGGRVRGGLAGPGRRRAPHHRPGRRRPGRRHRRSRGAPPRRVRGHRGRAGGPARHGSSACSRALPTTTDYTRS